MFNFSYTCLYYWKEMKKKIITAFFSKYKRKSASQKVWSGILFSYEASFIEWIDNEIRYISLRCDICT